MILYYIHITILSLPSPLKFLGDPVKLYLTYNPSNVLFLHWQTSTLPLVLAAYEEAAELRGKDLMATPYNPMHTSTSFVSSMIVI